MPVKYPWTTEQNCAHAIMLSYAAAMSNAKRSIGATKSTLLEQPILVKSAQIVDGTMDLVAFQLNTFDLDTKAGVKNICWYERGLPLYTTKPFHIQILDVEGLNMETFNKFATFILAR